MKRLRTAVIGCGHLGRIHAQLLGQLSAVDLVAVVDPQRAARERVAAQVGAPAVADYRELIGKLDAVVLAAPTFSHAEIAHELIAAHIHLLVEKPLAATYAEAAVVAGLARQHDVTLAVGHVERFNPAFVAVQQRAVNPLYIDAIRTGGFTFRSMDVGVVMDLMIHDLELVLALVDSPVNWISACGAPVVTRHEDFATARVAFMNGCVAEFKASRTSPTSQRQMSVYGPDEHWFVDFGQRSAHVVTRSDELKRGLLHVEQLVPEEVERLKDHVFETLLPTSQLELPESNPLRDELEDFVASVLQRRAPRVDGDHAAQAVWLAEEILAQLGHSPQSRQSSEYRRAAWGASRLGPGLVPSPWRTDLARHAAQR